MKFGKYEIEERPHSPGMVGCQCLIFFPNGYGASVVRFYITPQFTSRKVGSYGVDEDLWEMAILKGNEEDGWGLTYDTPITDDVIGYLSEDEVGNYLEQIEALPQSSTQTANEEVE